MLWSTKGFCDPQEQILGSFHNLNNIICVLSTYPLLQEITAFNPQRDKGKSYIRASNTDKPDHPFQLLSYKCIFKPKSKLSVNNQSYFFLLKRAVRRLLLKSQDCQHATITGDQPATLCSCSIIHPWLAFLTPTGRYQLCSYNMEYTRLKGRTWLEQQLNS